MAAPHAIGRFIKNSQGGAKVAVPCLLQEWPWESSLTLVDLMNDQGFVPICYRWEAVRGRGTRLETLDFLFSTVFLMPFHRFEDRDARSTIELKSRASNESIAHCQWLQGLPCPSKYWLQILSTEQMFRHPWEGAILITWQESRDLEEQLSISPYQREAAINQPSMAIRRQHSQTASEYLYLIDYSKEEPKSLQQVGLLLLSWFTSAQTSRAGSMAKNCPNENIPLHKCGRRIHWYSALVEFCLTRLPIVPFPLMQRMLQPLRIAQLTSLGSPSFDPAIPDPLTLFIQGPFANCLDLRVHKGRLSILAYWWRDAGTLRPKRRVSGQRQTAIDSDIGIDRLG